MRSKKKIYLRACKRCGEFFREEWRASYCKDCDRTDWRKTKKDGKENKNN